MATLAIGASINFFVGWGQSVTITTTHNVSGKWRFVPQNPESPAPNGSSRSFGPMAINQTVGPWDVAGQFYLDNDAGSTAVVTYTQNGNTAYTGNFGSLSSTGTVSGTGFSNYMAAPPSIGTTTPGIVKTSNLQATYTDSSGTPGNATNNSPRGRAAFAAAGTSVVITSTLVTATSTILVSLGGTDATLTSVRVTSAAGSFTVTGNAAATATTPFDWVVVN